MNCCVTSPPYWGLRCYGIPPSVWGGAADCAHEWVKGMVEAEVGRGNWAQAVNGRGEAQGPAAEFRKPITEEVASGFCRRCGAWLGCLGLEPTVDLYLANIVAVFEEVARVLRPDGTAWINLGDCYASAGGSGAQGKAGQRADRRHTQEALRPAVVARSGHAGKHSYADASLPISQPHRHATSGIKAKDLVGVPWLVAFALRSAGWYLRRDIVWHKLNPMPESVTDRPTSAHEYIFLMSRSDRYYYDADAIKEPSSPESHARYARGRSDTHKYADGGPLGQTIARTFEHMRVAAGVNPKARYKTPDGWDTTKGEGGHGSTHRKGREKGKPRSKQNESFAAAVKDLVPDRNKRSVWPLATHPFREAHFATFPPDLIRPCILAGAPMGGVVLDPFGGSGTTGMVSEEEGRNSILIELNPKYVEMQRRRTAQAGLFCGAGN